MWEVLFSIEPINSIMMIFTSGIQLLLSSARLIIFLILPTYSYFLHFECRHPNSNNNFSYFLGVRDLIDYEPKFKFCLKIKFKGYIFLSKFNNYLIYFCDNKCQQHFFFSLSCFCLSIISSVCWAPILIPIAFNDI
jgi:hypothetical protein